MVEDNSTSGSDPDRDEPRSGARKISRLFGGRRMTRRTESSAPATGETIIDSTETDQTGNDETGRAEASTDVSTQAPGQAPEASTAAPEPSTLAGTASAPALLPVTAEGEEPRRPVLPPASLLFQAPVLPDYVELTPLPPRGAPLGLRDERDERDAPSDEQGSIRRRSRRRSGENDRGGSDDPEQTVVRVRQPREPREAREPELITEPQRIKGSTRLEAKKQRRRDGRDAGRRRTVVTESEFLARREAVDRVMVVRSRQDSIRIGVLEDGVLAEHYVARSQEASLIGNVYLGRVQNVLPSMEAAFVDIGRGRNAVLYSGEVDWDAANNAGGPRRIELALKPGDRVLVQVTKDPVGHKGARLTSQISLPGRYLVYVPNGSMNGISRKLPDTERARLKKILKEVLPENVGVIVRTAAEGATEEQLTVDVERLTAQWTALSDKAATGQAPALLHSEPDLLIKIVRDVFNEDFETMVIAGDDARETIELYLSQVAPDLLERVEIYTGEQDAFDEFRITEQIEKALERKVWLPSGGSLVIDRTEAMTVVDVNTGKFVGSGGNLEETVTKNNLEAAEEIVRQLRLRDIGGIIVVDFIDMVLESNRDLVLRRLVECLSRDRTKHQVAEVTSLGLVQMTRKKLGLGLLETFSENCEVCAGRGVIVHHDPVLKHRSTAAPQQEQRRRGKGGDQQPASGRSNGASTAAAKSVSTHAITDDAKNALAQIAASTIQPQAARQATEEVAELVEDATETEPIAAPQEAGEKQLAEPASRGERPVRGERRRRSRDREPRQESAEAPVEQMADFAAAAILDIPIPPAPVTPPRRVRSDVAEHLLDSVLDALPAPKQPGQGRAKSRRVTTAALTGVAVIPEHTPRRADQQ
ncbi:Rne/Rng family ribonuclease [Rathayibacter iranicus]|uniref:Ribonuclease E n=2 Tax=Rathayibacter iranicus TaxID=59737 RepID=A0AAD1ELP9_9MICO|nr:Rne/Rng family ribonuclease [Rathayibacter iranicus]AZZ55276.1 ribonuclease E/G [Rathayibacter iranicus]MWV31006.1 Rne/Rng family ribonuclease [Rathayibacter iranicus NCPPB 2253 = VKM Ac-1602]PPI49233.1 ribonuclease E/G [Rathayibacter iranicus]PPI61667.1 ribonuclease E/G [Rathayibacter iranicus]PPI72391.1 ribonuclease E/G [Rathayibacter iranicus]